MFNIIKWIFISIKWLTYAYEKNGGLTQFNHRINGNLNKKGFRNLSKLPSTWPSSRKSSFRWSRFSFSLSALCIFLGIFPLFFLFGRALPTKKKKITHETPGMRVATIVTPFTVIWHPKRGEIRVKLGEWNAGRS